MANKVNITNNVTTHVVEVTPGVDSINLSVCQREKPHVVELNAGLFLAPPESVFALEQLTNVSSGATSGQVIQFNGTSWAPVTLPTPIDPASLFTPPTAVDEQFMKYNQSLDIWEAFTLTPEYVLPEAQQGEFLQFDGTKWVVVEIDFTQGGGGGGTVEGSGVLEADLTSTENVGGISSGDTLTAGTTLEEVFRTMLITYQAPVMSLTGWTNGTFEHGSTFTDTDYVLSFTNDSNIDTGVAGTYSIFDSFIGPANGAATAADGAYTVPSYNGVLLVTNTNAGTSVKSRSGAAKLTVSGFKNSEGNAITSQSLESTVRYRYWVVDSASQINSATDVNIQLLLGNTDLQLNGTGSGVIKSGLISSVSNLGFTSSGGNDYVYWVLPKAFNVTAATQNTSLNLYEGNPFDTTTAVIYIGDATITNQHGQSVNMQVFRTKQDNAFAANSIIAFS
jgi:hypothetical protein